MKKTHSICRRIVSVFSIFALSLFWEPVKKRVVAMASRA